MRMKNGISPIAAFPSKVFQIDFCDETAIVRLAATDGEGFFDRDPYIADLQNLIDSTNCERVVFDLDGFDSGSSTLLALLVFPWKCGVPVTVRNLTPHLREVITTTNMDRLIHLECESTNGVEPIGSA